MDTISSVMSNSGFFHEFSPLEERKAHSFGIGTATTANSNIIMLAAEGKNTTAEINMKTLSTHMRIFFICFIFNTLSTS